MTGDLPSVSIIIPTLNSARTLGPCLQSIFEQDFPRDKVEVIVADGGSSDKTVEIAREYRVVKILSNPLRTGEAGKAVGTEMAKNEIVAFVDSDNILPSADWLRTMVKPFKDREIAGTEPLYYARREGDHLITRYCALMGMNDVLCLFLGNYDRYSYMTGRWTELRVDVVNRGDYLLVKLDERNIPTMGANGFLVRAKAIKSIDYKPYLFDVDMVYQLVMVGWKKYAKVKTSIVHIFANSLATYVKKTRRRIADYLYYEKLQARKYPWRRLDRLGMLRFILCTLLIAPLIIDSLRGYRKLHDKAWFFHPLACMITLYVYSIQYILQGWRRV